MGVSLTLGVAHSLSHGYELTLNLLVQGGGELSALDAYVRDLKESLWGRCNSLDVMGKKQLAQLRSLEEVSSPKLWLAHTVSGSHCVWLTVSGSLWLADCGWLTVSGSLSQCLTVSLSRTVSRCLLLTVSHCASRCVWLHASCCHRQL